MLDSITIQYLKWVKLMEEEVRKNIYKVEILPEIYDAVSVLAKLYGHPEEAIVNRAIVKLFAAEHDSIIDFHHHCGCGEIADLCEDESYHIGAMNVVRKRVKYYENCEVCIDYGDYIDEDGLGPCIPTLWHSLVS
jgi:hypothetical protein